MFDTSARTWVKRLRGLRLRFRENTSEGAPVRIRTGASREAPCLGGGCSFFGRRHSYALALRKLLRLVISCVQVPDHAHARISREHAFDALGHPVGPIGHGDLPGMQRIPN